MNTSMSGNARRAAPSCIASLLVWGAVAAISAAAAAPAVAADRPFMRRLSVGASLGFQGIGDDSGLGNGNQPEEVPQSGVSLGLRLSYPLLPQLGVDAEANFTPTSLPATPARANAAATSEGSGVVVGLRLLARWDILTTHGVTPFVTAGFGQAILSAEKSFVGANPVKSSIASPDVDNTYIAGVGASYDLGYRGALRLDARWVGGDVRPPDPTTGATAEGLSHGYEVLLGFSWALGGPAEDVDGDGVPDETDKCVDKPEDKDGFEDTDGCPELDNDGDGVIDANDKCQGDLEDKDGFEDEDGCPELDNDGDGVPDAQDKCPAKAEDKDGYQDTDGCPELDNDGDGVPDAQDKCRDKAEDKDGFEDADGCPEADNDGDGVSDGTDKCPGEAETLNGVDDADGCPDAIAGEFASIFTTPLKKLKWKGAKLDKKSAKAFDKLIEFMLSYESARIEIEVHTAGKDAAAEKELAQQRGEAIKALLVDSAIDGTRVTIVPTAADKPISQATGKKAWAENERVEFRVVPVARAR